MRLTPLSREVRKFQRVPPEEKYRRDVGRWLVLSAVFALVLLLTSPFYFYRPPAAEEGERLPEAPVRAQITFEHVLQSSLEQWEEEREQRHRRVYLYDPAVPGEVLRQFEELLTTIDALEVEDEDPDAVAASLRRRDARFGFLSGTEAVNFVRAMKDPRLQQSLRLVIRDAYEDRAVAERLIFLRAHQQDGVAHIVAPSDVAITPRELVERALPFPVDWYEWNPVLLSRLTEQFGTSTPPVQAEQAARILLTALLQPNIVFDEERTREAWETYPRGDLATDFEQDQVLVGEEARVRELTGEEADLLQAHRAAVNTQHNVRLAGHALFVLIVFVILSFYVLKFSRDFQFTTYNVVLISLPVLLALMLQGFILVLAEGITEKVGYLFPAGAIGMLGVLLLDVRMALLLVTWGCLLFGLQVDLDYQYVIVGLFGGYTAVAAIYSIRRRWEVFRASIFIGAVQGAVILVTAYIQNPTQIPLDLAAIGFVGGIASFLVLAVLPVFERFGIITDMQLLELTGLHQPLLRHIEEVAPGTWQHTLNVTKLAEAAATAIGVNYLLVRAGCYYHDIGKTRKPEYFTENQITAEDKMRHAELKPQMSTLIIKNHVKEGAEMARRAGVPERIIDFIRQHHGTSVISYFYHKALEAQARGESKEPVRIEDYRYPGPKPQTIEAAIAMLADSVEAIATAKLSARTVREDDIQQIVRTTIFEKFNDGQFDESNLTLRDLNVIREVFVKVLKSRFHTRIDYPKKPSLSRVQRERRDAERPPSTSGETRRTEEERQAAASG